MMRNWRDSFVGSTLKGRFESSISGKLRDLTNMLLQVDNAYMHATTAADHVSFTAMQASAKGTITLDGTDVAFTGIVKDECHHHGMLMHGSYPIWGAVCKSLMTKRPLIFPFSF